MLAGIGRAESRGRHTESSLSCLCSTCAASLHVARNLFLGHYRLFSSLMKNRTTPLFSLSVKGRREAGMKPVRGASARPCMHVSCMVYIYTRVSVSFPPNLCYTMHRPTLIYLFPFCTLFLVYLFFNLSRRNSGFRHGARNSASKRPESTLACMVTRCQFEILYSLLCLLCLLFPCIVFFERSPPVLAYSDAYMPKKLLARFSAHAERVRVLAPPPVAPPSWVIGWYSAMGIHVLDAAAGMRKS